MTSGYSCIYGSASRSIRMQPGGREEAKQTEQIQEIFNLISKAGKLVKNITESVQIKYKMLSWVLQRMSSQQRPKNSEVTCFWEVQKSFENKFRSYIEIFIIFLTFAGWM